MTREERRYWRNQYIKFFVVVAVAIAAAVVIRGWTV